MENKQQPKENLRIQSSVYPEGWNPKDPASFNAAFQHIWREITKADKDPRHFQTYVQGAFCFN